MNKKDKKLIEKSVMAIADGVVSKIPGLDVAWNLSKALFEAGMELRQERALEFVEMIKDNPDIFIKKILKEKSFQDGFVYTLENYIRERNEEKRAIVKNIFLGFTKAKSKDNYPLEKMIHTTTQLGGKDILVLKDVDFDRVNEKNYQIYGNKDKNVENIYNLINLSLLLNKTGNNRIGPTINAPYVSISRFGKRFIEYIKN